ncbi:hypothetical protein SAMN05443633_10146 [Chryseobacterium arachidis]|uniref:Dolichyl-phosphate-mannose-protein mannosyltransferase n=2 Tax=Chryseobacterium arachidis TaxID=1416778 RepID=A0A1M4SR10_9FLAO|nr:hypothetical protein [Chryseobacterium arachidis]SHE34609.1 hypothetical protein SAMN05443633_10146 [Chryseobacterium arachidis]
MDIKKVSSNPAFLDIKNYSVFFVYLIVNSLFVIKYGENYIIPLLSGYLVMVSGISILYIKINLKDIVYKLFFVVGVILFFLFSIYLNYNVDGNSLNVDRWSAMEIGIKAIFNGQYPYNIPDHMGRESSNLPMLIVLGMPFYLLFGSVGYLQPFTFLFFTFLIFKIFSYYRQRLAVLILLFLSPSYLWEVYVKSDLFSNFMIITGFVYLIWRKFLKMKIMKLEIVSFLSALVLLTRFSSVIPLTILLIKKFFEFSGKEKLRFIAVFIFTISALGYIFFHNAPNLEVFLEHNPLIIQGAKQPLILSLSYIGIACILSFRVKSFYDTIFWIGILLFICVFVPFIMFFFEYGYTNMIKNSFFDLSFFNMCMPFVIITVILEMFKNHNKEIK